MTVAYRKSNQKMKNRNVIRLLEGKRTKGYHHHRHHKPSFSILHISLYNDTALNPALSYVNVNLIPSPGYLTPFTSLTVLGLSFCYSSCPAVISSGHDKSSLRQFFVSLPKYSHPLPAP